MRDFTLLATDSESDTEIYKIFSEPIFTRLPYTPPYDDKFSALMRIQLEAAKGNPFSLEKKQLVIDISEWAEHFSEEYFIISLRFFADMASRWSYVFVMRNCRDTDISEAFISLRCYMQGNCVKAMCRSDISALQKRIERIGSFTPEAARLMAQILSRQDNKNLCSDAFIESVARDITDTGKSISETEFISYLNSDASVFSYIMTAEELDLIIAENEKEDK